MEHEGGHQGLTDALIGLIQGLGELEGEERVLFPHLHRGFQAQHVVDGVVGEADGAGEGGADDVLPLGGVAAVALHLQAGEAAALRIKCYSGHQALMAPISTLV